MLWGLEYQTFKFRIHSKMEPFDVDLGRFCLRMIKPIVIDLTILNWNQYRRIQDGRLFIGIWNGLAFQFWNAI